MIGVTLYKVISKLNSKAVMLEEIPQNSIWHLIISKKIIIHA